MFKKDRHYSYDLEAAIIGACCIELTAFSRVRDFLKPEMFYHGNNKNLFEVLGEMYEKSLPIDLVTVVSYLVRDKKLESMPNGDVVAYYVSGCINHVCSTANLEYHSLILRQMYVDRTMILIRNSISTENDSLDEIGKMQRQLNKLLEIKSSDDWMSMAEVVIKLNRHIIEKEGEDVFGVTTGFNILDNIYGGFGDGDLIVLAARPSVGKTAFLMKLAKSAAKQFIKEKLDNIDLIDYNSKCVGIISLEMSDIKLASRVASMESNIDYWKIYRSRMDEEQERQKLYLSLDNMSKMPIYVSDTASVDLLDIKGKAMKLKSKHNLKILYIDYLQLIDTPDIKGEIRERQVAKLSRGLKLLAMELKIPIVLLAQLNRGSEAEKDKKPKLYHLRESGAIEQDADVVLLLHRDYMSGIKERANMENNVHIGNVSTESDADIIVAKWRDGMLGEYKIGFNGSRMEFYEPDVVSSDSFYQNANSIFD
jgi:replicative DNA helicase